jgi:Spy/CpxP family protein refolding chaperone
MTSLARGRLSMDCQRFEDPKWIQAMLSSLIGLSTVFSAVALSGVTSPVSAQTAPPGGDAGPGGRNDPLAIYREAGVSTEQENQIRQMVRAFEAETTTRIEDLRKMLKDMRDLSLQPSPNEAAVLAKQEEINRAQNDIATGRIKLLLKIRATLSKEQKQKLVDLMQHSPNVNQ